MAGGSWAGAGVSAGFGCDCWPSVDGAFWVSVCGAGVVVVVSTGAIGFGLIGAAFTATVHRDVHLARVGDLGEVGN